MSATTASAPAPAPVATGMRKNGKDAQSTNFRNPRSPLYLLLGSSPTNPMATFPLLGKNWHDTKKAFRPTAGLTSFAKRQELRKHQEAVKERERELKEEKEAERQVSYHNFYSILYYFHPPPPRLSNLFPTSLET